jgi:cell wall-associated NlpC family hydrolase
MVPLALVMTACYGYDNSTQGNSAGLAKYIADNNASYTRDKNPPWAQPGGFDCWSFINWVEDHATPPSPGTPSPGYHDVQSQGQFGYLQSDGFGANPGDIIVFALNGQPQTAVHAGIVTITSPGDFSYASWNSSVNPNEVIILQHVNSTAPDPSDGLTVIGSYVP